MTPTVDESLDALETFLATCAARGLELGDHGRLEPTTDAAVDAFEAATGKRVPEPLRQLYRRGVWCGHVQGDPEFSFAGVDFRALGTLHGMNQDWGDPYLEVSPEEVEEGLSVDDQLRFDQRRHGLPIQQTENTVVVDTRDGSVTRISGEPFPGDRIAASFSEFLHHFVACGCFSYGGAEREHLERYLEVMGDALPFGIPRRDNLWLQHLDRWYSGDLTSA